jgi:hypothetical protein
MTLRKTIATVLPVFFFSTVLFLADQPTSAAETNQPPRVINFKSKAIELSDALAQSLIKELSDEKIIGFDKAKTNESFCVSLNVDQAMSLLKRCEGEAGAKILNLPEIVAMNDHHLHIPITDIMTIITITNNLPILDVLPHLSEDASKIQLSVTGIHESMDTKDSVPMPLYRIKLLTHHASVSNGQTLLIGNPFQGKTNQLFVLVTPTFIGLTDSSGDMPGVFSAPTSEALPTR